MTLVTVDQILSGTSNILVLLFIAHLLSPRDFGLFTLVFLGYSLSVVSSRALVGASVLVHPEDADDRPRAVLGSTVLLAAGAGVACTLVGLGMLALDASLAPSVICLGALLPLMLVQDVGRYLAFANARPMRAVWLDALWIVLEVGAFSALLLRGDATLLVCIVAWAGTGALSGLLVLGQYGVPRPVDLTLAWLRSRWDFSWRSLATSVITEATTLAGFAVVSVISSAVAIAAVRAATLLTRPGSALLSGVAHASVAEMSRDRPTDRALRAGVRKAMLLSVLAAVANLAVLVALPDAVGRAVLGRTWEVAEPLLLAAGLQLVMIAARNGVRAALLSRREITLIMAADVTGGVLLIVLSVIGAVIADAQGIIWAGVIGQALISAGWAVVLRSRVGDDVAPVTPETTRSPASS